MKLLLDERKLIIAIGSEIEYGVWGNIKDLASWKVSNSFYVMGDTYAVVDIGDTEIPTYVCEHEYYYINGEFKLADECPNEYRDRIVNLETTVETQDVQIMELTEYQAEMLYDLSMLEMGITE